MNETQQLPPAVLEHAKLAAAAFLGEILGVTAVVIATMDGFDLASSIRDSDDPARIAAMGSSISALSNVVAMEAGLGEHKSVIINTDTGFAVVHAVYRANYPLVINVIADRDAILAQVIHRAAGVAKSLMD